MSLLNIEISKKLQYKQVIKIITGLNNFNLNTIIKKVQAAELGGATYVDIAANPEIVKIVRSITNLPICVSSIDPLELYNCYLVGADLFEIGNFDIFYRKKIYFSASQIVSLAQETQLLLGNKSICITIPHTLLLHEQIEVANKLQSLGINFVQTEGRSTKVQGNLGYHSCSPVFASINKASAALSSSYAIANSTDLQLVASSGISLLSASIAVYYGASAVGVGSSISSSQAIYKQSKTVSEIVNSVSCQKKNIFIGSFKMYKVDAYPIRSKIL